MQDYSYTASILFTEARCKFNAVSVRSDTIDKLYYYAGPDVLPLCRLSEERYEGL